MKGSGITINSTVYPISLMPKSSAIQYMYLEIQNGERIHLSSKYIFQTNILVPVFDIFENQYQCPKLSVHLGVGLLA